LENERDTQSCDMDSTSECGFQVLTELCLAIDFLERSFRCNDSVIELSNDPDSLVDTDGDDQNAASKLKCLEQSICAFAQILDDIQYVSEIHDVGLCHFILRRVMRIPPGRVDFLAPQKADIAAVAAAVIEKGPVFCDQGICHSKRDRPRTLVAP